MCCATREPRLGDHARAFAGYPRINSTLGAGDDSLMAYRVLLRESDEGWAVWVPSLPGCASQDSTEYEALENIKDAIAGTSRCLVNSTGRSTE